MSDFNWDLSQLSASDFESFEQEFLEEFQKKQLAEKRREWGKLGGRPAPKGVRTVQKNIRLREEEYLKIEAKAEKFGITVSELFRRSALAVALPDPVRNKALVQAQLNFKRISNYFQKTIWTEEEKGEVISEIKEVISIIKKNLK